MEASPGLLIGVLEGACRRCGELLLQILKVALTFLQLLEQHHSAQIRTFFDMMVLKRVQ